MNKKFNTIYKYPMLLDINYMDKYNSTIPNKDTRNNLINLDLNKKFHTLGNYINPVNFKYNVNTRVAKCYYENLLLFTWTEYKDYMLIFIGNQKYKLLNDYQFYDKALDFFQYSILKQIDFIKTKSEFNNCIINNVSDLNEKELLFSKYYEEYYGHYNFDLYTSDFEKFIAYHKKYKVELHELYDNDFIYYTHKKSGDGDGYYYLPKIGKVFIKTGLDIESQENYARFNVNDGSFSNYSGLHMQTILENLGII